MVVAQRSDITATQQQTVVLVLFQEIFQSHQRPRRLGDLNLRYTLALKVDCTLCNLILPSFRYGQDYTRQQKQALQQFLKSGEKAGFASKTSTRAYHRCLVPHMYKTIVRFVAIVPVSAALTCSLSRERSLQTTRTTTKTPQS